MWFGCNPCINFCHFFPFVNFVIFWPQILWKYIDSGYLVSATPHTILYRSFWNFAHVFSMVWRYTYGLNIILALIFVTFSTLWTCHFLTPDAMKVYGQWVPCEPALYTISYLSFYNFAYLFFRGLNMCMWFGFNPAVNFFVSFPLCHFSVFCTCDISFTEVRSFYSFVMTHPLCFSPPRNVRYVEGL